MTGITINGTWYDVKIVYGSLKRQFQVVSGVNAGTSMSGREIPDIVGTKISYTMTFEPNPSNRDAYDDLILAIFAPVDYVSIRVPYEQSPVTFNARVVSGSDTFGGTMAAENIWQSLTVTFVPISPQRVAT